MSSPLIGECPLSFECKVLRSVDVGKGKCYLAEILETRADEGIVTGEKGVDARALDPLTFTLDGYYHKLGERIGKAWQIGSRLEAGAG